MNNETFDKILKDRLDKIVAVLGSKGEEYSSEGDRLHNFKVAARIGVDAHATPEEALWGMLNKHLVSVMDIVAQCHEERCSEEILNEKLGDTINYFILLEALLRERFGYHE